MPPVVAKDGDPENQAIRLIEDVIGK